MPERRGTKRRASIRPAPAWLIGGLTVALLTLGAIGMTGSAESLPAGATLSLAGIEMLDNVPPWMIVFTAVALAVAVAAVALSGLRRGQPPAPATKGRWIIRIALLGLVFWVISLDRFRHSSPPTLGGAEGRPVPAPASGDTGVAWSWSVSVGLAVVVVLLALLIALALHRSTPPTMQPAAARADDEADLSARLHRAVQEGRAAVGGGEPQRDSIIGCYQAMERALALAGTRRAPAETPTDLLDRAVSAGLVRSDAAVVLTRLFRRARFSSRPLPPDASESAARALDRLDAELAATPGEPHR